MNIAQLPSGKVRELYDIGNDRLVIVTSDRISAFDVVLPDEIPLKGVVLNRLTEWWMNQKLWRLAPNHFISTRPSDAPSEFDAVLREGRAMVVRKMDEMLPVECIVRGYITGSAWKQYQKNGTVNGLVLPAGLHEGDELPEPIFTPSTKEEGPGKHDVNITFAEMVDRIGPDHAERVRELSLTLFRAAAEAAKERGMLLADTKLEFGLLRGNVHLADEAFTPDSARYWLAGDWQPGTVPPPYDKQLVRDYLDGAGWSKEPPAPPLPPEIIAQTTERYLALFRKLTGHPLAA